MGFANGITKPHNLRELFATDIPDSIPFDVTDADLFHDLMGNDRMGKAAQAVCDLAYDLGITDASFGADAEKFKARAVPVLLNFLKACRQEWEDK